MHSDLPAPQDTYQSSQSQARSDTGRHGMSLACCTLRRTLLSVAQPAPNPLCRYPSRNHQDPKPQPHSRHRCKSSSDRELLRHHCKKLAKKAALSQGCWRGSKLDSFVRKGQAKQLSKEAGNRNRKPGAQCLSFASCFDECHGKPVVVCNLRSMSKGLN